MMLDRENKMDSTPSSMNYSKIRTALALFRLAKRPCWVCDDLSPPADRSWRSARALLLITWPPTDYMEARYQRNPQIAFAAFNLPESHSSRVSKYLIPSDIRFSAGCVGRDRCRIRQSRLLA